MRAVVLDPRARDSGPQGALTGMTGRQLRSLLGAIADTPALDVPVYVYTEDKRGHEVEVTIHQLRMDLRGLVLDCNP